MKNFSVSLLLLLLGSVAFAQKKDFSKVNNQERNALLNKKLQWINTNMGHKNGWRTLEELEGFGTVDHYEFDTLLWDAQRPDIVRIRTYVRMIKPKKPGQKDAYRELGTVTIDLSKVYQVKYTSGVEKTKLISGEASRQVPIKFIGNEMELSTYKEEPNFTMQYKMPPQGQASNSKAFSATAHFDPAVKGQVILNAWNDAIMLAGGGKILESKMEKEPALFGKLTEQIQQNIFASDTVTISNYKIKTLAMNLFGDVVISSDASASPERFNLLNLVSDPSNSNKGFLRDGEKLVFYTNIEQVMREDNSTYEVARVLELKFTNADAAKEVEQGFAALYKYLLSPASE